MLLLFLAGVATFRVDISFTSAIDPISAFAHRPGMFRIIIMVFPWASDSPNFLSENGIFCPVLVILINSFCRNITMNNADIS